MGLGIFFSRFFLELQLEIPWTGELQRSPSEESSICPSCQFQTIKLSDSCSVCDWFEESDRFGSLTNKVESCKELTLPSQDRRTMEKSQLAQQDENISPVIEYLNLDEIRRDGGTQPRAKIDTRHILLLENQIEDGFELEPVIVFYDDEFYWLADGFHRWHAHKNQGEEVIAAHVFQGSLRDAILYSVGANADHKPALPRSQADKRRAVLTLLQDPQWSQWSDREIARQCKVSDRTVNRLRQFICDNVADTKLNIERKFRRKGQTYTINTTNIGKSRQEELNEDKPNLSNPKKVADYSSSAGQLENNGFSNRDLSEVTDYDIVADKLIPQKVEVNTKDILIAFVSNLEYMSEAQVEAAVRAIARVNPELIRKVMESLE